VGHYPLSPLARTPSPSPISSSPTRTPSPSPLAVSVSPKGPFNRTKKAEPASPLLRRALSPDRHQTISREAKAISPLCTNPAPKVTISSPHLASSSTTHSHSPSTVSSQPTVSVSVSLVDPPSHGSTTTAALPRIAEEKDTPKEEHSK